MFTRWVTMLALFHFLRKNIDALLACFNTLRVLATLKLAKSFVKKNNWTITITLLNKDIVLQASLIIKT